ncbi:hypothetical protein O181_058039 [Austropuccinia psidii MF-1]|uniref:Uncharacterized protein n=1 Tax=Austropuccinia psidii MF-1 TaxID=1389203 RepID=A0A9Q3EBK4_9BASI|nr:hypothetical protein [Austropuccinia psidii MF-1]
MMANALDEESKPLVELNASYDELEDPYELERLRIRREVLQILADVSHGIDLNKQSNQTVMAIMRLALFFLSNLPNQINHTAYGGGELGEELGTLKPGQELSPVTLVRLRSLLMVPSHVDTGLSLISKIATLDGNRKKIE